VGRESAGVLMKKKMKFETALRELEKIVTSLEDQDMPLEKALAVFEEGVKLSKYCNGLLEEAEKKVKILLKEEETGEIAEREFQDIGLDSQA